LEPAGETDPQDWTPGGQRARVARLTRAAELEVLVEVDEVVDVDLDVVVDVEVDVVVDVEVDVVVDVDLDVVVDVVEDVVVDVELLDEVVVAGVVDRMKLGE